MKMLIVDDVMTNSAIMKRMAMRVFNGEIDIVSSGHEALQACEAKNYDIIVTDYMMPDMDGLKLVALLRHMDAHEGTPIIMASACHEPQLLQTAKAVGVTSFIAKPIPMDIFRNMIDRFANMPTQGTKMHNNYVSIRAA
jgi:putative two-component system response regulator